MRVCRLAGCIFTSSSHTPSQTDMRRREFVSTKQLALGSTPAGLRPDTNWFQSSGVQVGAYFARSRRCRLLPSLEQGSMRKVWELVVTGLRVYDGKGGAVSVRRTRIPVYPQPLQLIHERTHVSHGSLPFSRPSDVASCESRQVFFVADVPWAIIHP